MRKHTGFAEAIRKEAEKSPCVTLKDLKISGNDLINANIPPKNIGKINAMLLQAVIERPELNEKQALIDLSLSFNIS